MSESLLKEDPLSRIQREIIEVTEREREFKEGHFRVNRLLSESTLAVHEPREQRAPALHRAVSTSTLLGPVAPSPPASPALLASNGYTRRFTPQNGTKGLMQRFIANKGKINITSPVGATPPGAFTPPLAFTPSPVAATPPYTPPAVARAPDGKLLRKGFVPVEEKIQKELREMKDREHELKRMRKKKTRPFDLELSSGESSDESEDEDASPGRLKPARSIGELYEALNEELRTPSPRHSSGQESLGSLKPAKSLAELCELRPGQEFLAPSSTRLIAQWESIIQQKQEAGAA